ncbi:hypothetical protein [Streptomyces niveus]|uniref:hypothetical protein n=1 Tax=Streptomyces niveus TaxID=193462 RepID=UPI00342A01E5
MMHVARQLADDYDAPGWARCKLAAIQPLRRAAQGVVDELGHAVQLEVFDAVAESCHCGYRAAVAEFGEQSDRTWRPTASNRRALSGRRHDH